MIKYTVYNRCCLCENIDYPDHKWNPPDIEDRNTGKYAHKECYMERQQKLSYKIWLYPCCKPMVNLNIKVDPFTDTFAIYPDNSLKYYFNRIKYCPFCAKEIKKD